MGTPRISSVGRYELLIELARGGMAELYLARLHGVGGFAKLVAIKRILPHLAEDKQFVEMFLNEGRIAAQLAHPNVCQVHELDEHEGDLFLAMEYLEGVSWDDLIKGQPRTPETLRLVAGVIGQACEGLHYAHELRDLDGTLTPVIHRDVSPQNLFVTVEGVCKVLDFGVSKIVKDGPRTRTGVIKGKLPYMSPEQIQGDPIDARADVFALGVVVWEALAGESLFDRDTDFQIWKAVTEAPVPPLAPRGFPPEVDAILEAALARDRDRRFRTARALGEALRHAAEQVGGAYEPAEIVAAVRANCGAQLDERQREVASIVTRRRSQPRVGEPNAADTIEEADPTDTAGSTVSLRSDRPGSTVSLRQDPVKVARPAPRRARWPLVVVAAGVIGAVAVALALGGDDRGEPTTAGDATIVVEATPSATDPATGDAIRDVPGPGSATASEAPPTEAAAGPATPPAGAASGATTTRGADRRAKLDRAMGVLDRLEQVNRGTRAPAAGAGSPDRLTAAMRLAGVGSDVERMVDDAIGRRPSRETSTAAPGTAPATAGTGAFSVDSTPYATIFLSGTKLGETPLFKVPVAAGKHRVRAVLADGRERTFTVVVTAGELVSSGMLTW